MCHFCSTAATIARDLGVSVFRWSQKSRDKGKRGSSFYLCPYNKTLLLLRDLSAVRAGEIVWKRRRVGETRGALSFSGSHEFSIENKQRSSLLIFETKVMTKLFPKCLRKSERSGAKMTKGGGAYEQTTNYKSETLRA